MRPDRRFLRGGTERWPPIGSGPCGSRTCISARGLAVRSRCSIFRGISTVSDCIWSGTSSIDLQRMRRSVYWPGSHTEVLRLLLEKGRNGTRIVFIPSRELASRSSPEPPRAGASSGSSRDVHESLTHVCEPARVFRILPPDEIERRSRSLPTAAEAPRIAGPPSLSLPGKFHDSTRRSWRGTFQSGQITLGDSRRKR